MTKKNFKKSIIIFIYFLSITIVGPYNFIFNLSTKNLQSEPVVSQVLVVRYYQAFGNGDSFGWQTQVVAPAVYVNGNPTNVSLQFGYTSPYYSSGGVGLGFDQYAQYYSAWVFPTTADNPDIQVTVSGLYQQVAYMSASIYQYYLDETEKTTELIDNSAITFENGCNPDVVNNPSVFAYPALALQDVTANKIDATNPLRKNPIKPLHPSSIDPTGKIALFRLDQEDSADDFADDVAPDGCSRAYLFGSVPENTFALLRIKVPKTFVDSDHPDEKFKVYPTRYISVGAHYNYATESGLDFWTVNGRMLKQYEDKAGYAYVFFAPNAYVQNIVKEQGIPPTQPPVITWGKYTGYLLGEPDYAIIIRYRVPNPNWQGSPENAICYATEADLKPVTKKELGSWLPEVYSGTQQEFLNGKLGILQKETLWPEF